MTQPIQIIGLSGTIGSGKDTLAQYLDEHHRFMHISTGDMVRAEAMRREGTIERPALKKVATQLRIEGGGGVLVQHALQTWRDAGAMQPLIITGIRSLGEANAIRAAGGKLIFVDAPFDVRFKRIVQRHRDTEAAISAEEFKKRDDAEHYAGPSDTDHNLRAIKEMSDTLLDNSKGRDAFIAEALHSVLNK